MTHPLARLLTAAISSLLLYWPAETGQAALHTYETGYQDLVRISGELYQALDAKCRQELHPEPVFLNQIPMPYLQLGLGTDGTKTWRAVHFSSGFVDFLNYFSHARALGTMDQGFFFKYLAALAGETGDKPLNPISGFTGQNAWSFDTMNHQASYFNQIAGALIAIEMAEHYLGYYSKYAPQLTPAQHPLISINSLLKPDEWRNAVLTGARNALDCGLGVEGMKALLEAIEKMPGRPAWMIYFVPNNVQLSKLRRELEHMEKDFFVMKK